jgi:hypothetical protein
MTGHKSYNCPNKTGFNNKSDYTQPKVAACQIECREKNEEIFPLISAVVDDETYLHDLKYPFKGQAYVDGQKVNYMRDTGSTLTIVQDKLVHDSRLTGNKVSVLLADRCVRYLPEAIVHLKCPCYEGKVRH